MNLKDTLATVRNETIKFVTMRPPDSPFATLERRVVVTGPEALVKLIEAGDRQILHALTSLLKEPDRAWAAEVLLATLTRREEKIVDTFAATPDQWWDSVGKSAYERWSMWVQETSDRIAWDSVNKVFIEIK